MMAYSYDPPGTRGQREILAAQEWEGALCFAGEATSTNGAHALVSGALDTGYRAASQALLGIAAEGRESGK